MTTRPITVFAKGEAVETAGVAEYRYRWHARAEQPVEPLLMGAQLHETRTAALRDFQETCELLGWDNDAMEVRL